MINTNHYFDWAATTPPDIEILKEALDFSIEHWGNPSSIHEAGTDAKKALDNIRSKCSSILGVSPDTLYFTSGGTEGDHIPLLSVLTRPQRGSIIVSEIEHPALREMSKMLVNTGWKVIPVSPDKNGIILPEAIVAALQDDTVFITVMAVNNETGAIQPIYDISDAITKATIGKRRPFFHVDCVQAAGKIPINLTYKGIDSASFSAHKICGPRGIGLLYLSKQVTPFLRGGGQEKNIRSGTENLYGAKAFASCLEKYFITTQNPKIFERYNNQKEYSKQFIEELKKIPICTIIPHSRGTTNSTIDDKFSPWVIQAAFHGIPGQVMVRALSSDGFYISTGSACSASKQSRPILDAMHISGDEKETAVRLSFGAPTTKQQMDELLIEIKNICQKFSK